MRRSAAAVASAVFFLPGPCVVAGLIPWLVTRWHVPGPMTVPMPYGPGCRGFVHGSLILNIPATRVDQPSRLSIEMGDTRSAGSKPKIRPRK